MKNALIDLDIIVYRGVFACLEAGIHAQRRACDHMVDGILSRLKPADYTLVLTGKGNFRKKIDPTYKAHRKPPPDNLYDVQQYLLKYWDNCIQTQGIEADDYIAMHSTPESVIVSSDKDYLTVPNTWLYNPWKDEMVWNDEETAAYNFYLQCLTGDVADNVRGIHGIGPKTGKKLLYGKSQDFMRDVVIDTYRQHHPEDWFTRLDNTATLLFLLRKENATYDQYYL